MKLADDGFFRCEIFCSKIGKNQHFYNSKNPYEVKNNDDEFFTYLSLTPKSPGNAAIWRRKLGASCLLEDSIPYGREGTVTKVKMGLFELGKWIRLSVKAEWVEPMLK